MNQTKIAATISAVIVSAMLAGCSSGGGGGSDKAAGEENVVNPNLKFIKVLEDGVTEYDSRMWQFASKYQDGLSPAMPEVNSDTYAVEYPAGSSGLSGDLYEHMGMRQWEEKDRTNYFSSCNGGLMRGDHALVYNDSIFKITNPALLAKHALVTALSDQSYDNALQKLNVSQSNLADLTPVYGNEDMWRLMNIWLGIDLLPSGDETDLDASAWVSLGVIADYAGFDIGGLSSIFPTTDPEILHWNAGPLQTERQNILYGWYQTLSRAEKRQWALETQRYMDDQRSNRNSELFNEVYENLKLDKAQGSFQTDKMPVCISSKLPIAQVALATKYGVVVANPEHIPANVLQTAIRRETARYAIRAVAGKSDSQHVEYWFETGLANLIAGFTVADRADASLYHPMTLLEQNETNSIGRNDANETLIVGHASYQSHVTKAVQQIQSLNQKYAGSAHYGWVFDLLFTMRGDSEIWKAATDINSFYPSFKVEFGAMNRAFNQNYFADGALNDYGYSTLKEIKDNYFNIAM